jgi:Cu/Ag efflux pump CusA
MRALVGWSLKFPVLVLLVSAAVVAIGINHVREAPVDALPQFTPTYVEIQTEALGLSAAEVEQLITVPMEAELLNGVAGIETIRSQSVMGLSSIVLVFEPGTHLHDARQLVQERLIQSNILPHVSKPPQMLQPLSSESRVMMVGLQATDMSMIDMSVLARWTIRPRLMGIPGVANVSIWGQRDQQLQVLVEPGELARRGVTLSQVIATTGNAQLVSPLSFLQASTPGTGGFIDTPNQRLQIRHVLPIGSPEALARVPVEGAANGLRLGDVATVVVDHQPLIGDAVIGDGDGLLLVVEKLPGANTREVTEALEDALDGLRPGLSGMEADPSVFRPANYLEDAISNLTVAVVIGAALLVFALIALVLEWRKVLVILVSVPVSLVAAALVLTLRGESMNAMVVGGLALALVLVIHDAVAGAEAVWERQRAQAESGQASPRSAIVDAAVEVRGTLAYATLAVVVAVVPVFFMNGLAGAFLEPLVLSYALALGASMLVGLMVAPALGIVLLSQSAAPRPEAPLVRAIKRGYAGLIGLVMLRPWTGLAAAGVLLVAGLATLPFLGHSLLPSFQQRELMIRLDGAPATSRGEMARIAGQMTRELRAVDGVANVGAHVGRAIMSDEIVSVSSGEVWVTLDRDADYDSTLANVEEVVRGYPGFEGGVTTYARDRIAQVAAVDNRNTAVLDGLGERVEPVVVRVYGPNPEQLRSVAEDVRATVSGVDGVVNPQVETEGVEPALRIEVDLERAASHGIKPGDVRRAAATLLQGIDVGSFFEEQKVFDVVVTGVPSTRHSLSSVRGLLIDTPEGGRVQLDEVADVTIAPSPTVINREAVSRRLDVVADVQGRDLGAVLADIEDRLANSAFPLEYHADVLGDSAAQQAQRKRLLLIAAGALLAVFLLLQAAFGSFRLAALLFVSLPLALAGGLVAVLIDGGTVTIGSMAGFLTILALASRQGVMLMRRYQRIEQDGSAGTHDDIAVAGALQTVTTTVVTSVVTAAALLPLIVLGSRAGTEVVHPMAVVVLGGLASSLVLTLLILPLLFMHFGSTRRAPAPRQVVVARTAQGETPA